MDSATKKQFVLATLCLYGEPNWFGDKLLSFNSGGEGRVVLKPDGTAASPTGGSCLWWSFIHTQWQGWGVLR